VCSLRRIAGGELEEREREFAQIVGKSAALEFVLAEVERVGTTDSTVLILGETGTGKELIARAIHNTSERWARPFIKLNCAAIPSELLESELFGHEQGAFTGAIAQRVGRFEMANNGTLLLDEIGDLPLALQPKLLRVLQDQEFERLGSSRTQRVNVRIVAATHRDLAEMVERNEFRSDLYYRLNVFPISVPPLRNRRDDIPNLILHFTQVFSKRMRRQIDCIPDPTMNAFVEYDWPGNVRELQNMVERAVIRSNDGCLANPLPQVPPRCCQESKPMEWTRKSGSRADSLLPSKAIVSDTLEDVQRKHILQILDRTEWVISGPSGAASILNLHPNTLRSLMSRLGIRNDRASIREPDQDLESTNESRDGLWDSHIDWQNPRLPS